ncbi:MAG TPA: metallopeptidase family protein [Anaerolineae bacterium]|nr:metallopeptidase family protein [Anaerolineae bacterium]
MDRVRFEELVAEALQDVPDFFRQRLDNVVLVVADWPSHSDLISTGLHPGQSLLGLYQGVPQTKRSSGYGMVTPDRITIFMGPVLSICRSEQECRDEVRRVVLHELGHHFGLSDERLRELGV